MPNFNKVILCGNMTKDPELRYIPSGAAVCEFTLAINKKWKTKDGVQKDEVSYIDCVSWARTAEIVAQFMKKGRPLLVEGELRQERWQDQSSGQNRSKVKVNVQNVQFVGAKPEGGGAGATEEPSGPPANDQADIPF